MLAGHWSVGIAQPSLITQTPVQTWAAIGNVRVPFFLWLADESYNLGPARQQTSKRSHFHIRLECESCPGKKLSNFLPALITKRIPFHCWCMLLFISEEHCGKMNQVEHVQNALLSCGMTVCVRKRRKQSSRTDGNKNPSDISHWTEPSANCDRCIQITQCPKSSFFHGNIVYACGGNSRKIK